LDAIAAWRRPPGSVAVLHTGARGGCVVAAARAPEEAPMIGTRSVSLAARVRGHLALLHPFPVIMTVLAAVLFAVIAAHGSPPPGALGLLIASVLLTQVAIATLNDYCDQSLDAATKPGKPLPAGLVSPRLALTVAVITAPMGLLFAVPLGPIGILAAALFTGSGVVYDLWLKGTAWSAVPFLVAFPALPIWAWSAVAPFEPRLLESYVIGGPLVVGLHLADTLPDLEGDLAQGLQGLAHRLGAPGTRRLMWGTMLSSPLALVVLAALPGRPANVLGPAGVAAALCVLGAFLVSSGGETAVRTPLASTSAAAASGRVMLDARQRWRVAFALLVVAAIVVGLGWLASVGERV
jgi:4-hydroxybenzoate polyprenyltransferase